MEGNDLSNVKLLEYYGVFLPPEGPGWKPLRCPFHEDKTASASSNGSGFVCFACGIKGNAISLIMEREGLGYHDALKFAEEIIGDIGISLRKATIYERKRFDLSGEKRSYERDSGIFSTRISKRSASRKRPRFPEG